VKFRLVFAAALIAALAACTPEAETDGAAAPAAPPAADIAAPAPDAGPAAPNTTDTLSTTPPDAAAPAQTTAPAAAPAASASAATPAEIINGRGVYARTCAMCHGPTGQGTQIGVAITMKDTAAIADKVAKGGEKMPPMASMLSADDIDDVSKFVAAGLPQ
jgi:mono/diheme cytochrome c family protein